VQNPADPINPNLKDPSNPARKAACYSNYNFGIFRVLLPMIDGFKDDPASSKLIDAYIKLVQTHVFEPVGAHGVDAKPPASGAQASAYAFSYHYPGTEAGTDWGDNSAGVGAAGWYLAIEDIDKVLFSLNKNDGRILTPAQMQDMETTPLGWDTTKDGTGYRWVEKNGGWGSGLTSISTSIALFGPGVFGALFVNSDRSRPNFQNNWQWCKNCHGLAYAANATQGNCPAGGQHDHTGSSNYIVATKASGVAGQDNWRWCNKCQALSFAGSASLGPCSAGGQHDHTGSGNYVLVQKSGALPPYTQNNWKWCKKCQVLALAGGSTGPCGGGGTHDFTASGDYVLEFQVGADTVLRDAYMSALKPK
jgi:hypothetical protein